MEFFKGYIFEQDELKMLEGLWLYGDILPTLNRRELMESGIPLGLASRIIKILQDAAIQSGK